MPYFGGSFLGICNVCSCVFVQVGDFAILLRAGFDRWSAARMQLSTALVGVLGASTALCCQSPQSTGECPRGRQDHVHGSSRSLPFYLMPPMFGIPSKTFFCSSFFGFSRTNWLQNVYYYFFFIYCVLISVCLFMLTRICSVPGVHMKISDTSQYVIFFE